MPLGFPPYSQQSSSGDRYSFDDLPPEIATEHQALNRKQQIANMLIQQGLQPAQGQMVGGWYVPASPLQGVAGLAQILAGKYASNRNDEARKALSSKSNNMLTEAMQKYKSAIADKTTTTELEGPGAPVRTAYPGDGFSPEELKKPTALYGTMAESLSKLDESRPSAFFKEGARPTQTTVTPTTSEEKRQALIEQLAMSSHPQAQRMGQFLLSEMDRKEARGDMLAFRKEDREDKQADSAIARQSTLEQKMAELEQRKAQDAAMLDIKKDQFASTAEYQKAQLALEERHNKEAAALKRELWNTPSANALASIDVQGQIALQGHQDRMTQFDQNKRQDEAMLEMKKAQGLSDEAYRRDKLAMDAKHQQQQVALEAERNKISSAFHDAQAKDKADKPPAGYEKVPGGLKAIPGGPADMKQQGAFNQDTAMLQNSSSGMDRLAESANQLLNHPGLAGITGLRGAVPDVPGTQAADARALLNKLKSQVGFSVLQDMRNNSKTGGALGAVSDNEGKRLEANLGSVESAQSIEQMRRELKGIIDYTSGAKSRLRDAFNLKHKQGEGVTAPSPEPSGGVAPFNDAEKERRYQEFKKKHK